MKGKSNKKHRQRLFKFIKYKYKKDILEYDMSWGNLMLYADAVREVDTLLAVMDPQPSYKELKRRLGSEFFKWYTETQYEISEILWDKGVTGFD